MRKEGQCVASKEWLATPEEFTNSENWCSWISLGVCVWGIVWIVCCCLVWGCGKHDRASLVSGNSLFLLSALTLPSFPSSLSLPSYLHPSSLPPSSLPLSFLTSTLLLSSLGLSPFPSSSLLSILLSLSLRQHTLQDLTVTVVQTFIKSIPLVGVLATVFLSYSFIGHILFGAVRTGEAINYGCVCAEGS